MAEIIQAVNETIPEDSFFYFDNKTGVFYANESAINEGIIDIMRGVFGDDLSLRPETIAGTFMNIFQSIVMNCAHNMAYMSNQSNINYAEGFYLNLIGESKGLPRHQGSKASVQALVTGVPGLHVPAGIKARTILGDIFVNPQDFTLDEEGKARVLFTSEDIGLIVVSPHSLNTLVTRVEGLGAIDNLEEGIPGRGVETEGAYRSRLIKSSYLTSNTTPKSIETYVLDQNPEAISVKVINNKTEEPIEISSRVTIPAGAFWVGVFGGLPQGIAKAIFQKSGGAVSVGTRSETITDSNGTDYIVKFSYADPVTYDILVQVGGNINNIADKINDAIERYRNGTALTGKSIKIGEDITNVYIAQVLSLEIPTLSLDIQKVQIGKIVSTDKEEDIRNDLKTQKENIVTNESTEPMTSSAQKRIVISAMKAIMDKLAIKNIEASAEHSDIISIDSLQSFKLESLSMLTNDVAINTVDKILSEIIKEAEKTHGLDYKGLAEQIAEKIEDIVDLKDADAYKWLLVATHTFTSIDKLEIKADQIGYPNRVKVIVKHEEHF